MRIKIFIISFCAFLFSFLIYKVYSDDRLNVLSIGDDLSLGLTPFNSYGESYNDFLKSYLNKYNLTSIYNDYFISEGETFESILHKFNDDYNLFVKNKSISLRKSIADADIIILSLGSEKTFGKCGLSKEKFIDYIDEYFDLLNEFIDKIAKISNSDIIVIGGYCFDYNEEVNQHILNLVSSFNDNVYFINLYNEIHESSIYIPNKNMPFPSLEGYDFIFKRIVFSYDFVKK